MGKAGAKDEPRPREGDLLLGVSSASDFANGEADQRLAEQLEVAPFESKQGPEEYPRENQRKEMFVRIG